MTIASFKEKAKNFSILYAEDEKEVRERTADLFTKLFLNVDVAIDGQDGLNKYHQGQYDIVITDILMPMMNGYELIKSIREKDKNQEIIILSAHSDSEFLTKFNQLGITGCIFKPVNMEQMITVLQKAIDNLIALRTVTV